MDTAPTILLVDDQPDLLDNLSLTLEMAGYRTIIARHGLEALARLQNRVVHLIVSDINMPCMGGYQLYHRIRENPDWETIPFIFLTGYRSLSDREIHYGQTLGIDEYLTKPISADDLLMAVTARVPLAPSGEET